MATQAFFVQLLAYVNLYQHAKNHAFSPTCSGDMVDKKILQSNWLRRFWPISQEQKSFQIWHLRWDTAKNISLLLNKFRKN